MWVLIDKDLDRLAQLYGALDGGLFPTKPTPSFKWSKPVRVVVTIQEVAPRQPTKARKAMPSLQEPEETRMSDKKVEITKAGSWGDGFGAGVMWAAAAKESK